MMTAMTMTTLRRLLLSIGVGCIACMPALSSAAPIDRYYYHLSVQKHIGTEVHHLSGARGSVNFVRKNHTQRMVDVLHRKRAGSGTTQ